MHHSDNPLRRKTIQSLSKFAKAAAGAALALAVAGGCATSQEEKEKAGGAVAEVPSGNFAQRWRAEIPVSNGINELHLTDSKVLVYGGDNRIFWVNRDSGHIVSVVRGARGNDTIYDALSVGKLVIIPSTTQVSFFDQEGKLAYKIASGASISSGANGDDRTIVFGTDSPNGGRVTAINTKQQQYELTPIWELLTRGQVSATPAVYEEGVFAGSRDGSVYAVRIFDREALWPGLQSGTFKTGGEILADLKADRDGVYVASTDAKLYCLDRNTGRIRWVYYAGVPLAQASSPVVTSNMVYISIPRTGLAAIDKTEKNEIRAHKWLVPNVRQFLARDDKYVYLRTDANGIIGVDKNTGEVQLRSQRKDFVAFATNTDEKDATIYAATQNGRLYAVRAVTKPGTVGEMVLESRPVDRVAAAR